MVQLLWIHLVNVGYLFTRLQAVPVRDGMSSSGQLFDDRQKEIGVAVGRVRRQKQNVGADGPAHQRQQQQQRQTSQRHLWAPEAEESSLAQINTNIYTTYKLLTINENKSKVENCSSLLPLFVCQQQIQSSNRRPLSWKCLISEHEKQEKERKQQK